MVRKIYEKVIYTRGRQLNRKVYQRSNNVLPIEMPTAVTGEDDNGGEAPEANGEE